MRGSEMGGGLSWGGSELGAHLVLLRIDPGPQERRLPAVHVLLRVAGQLDLPQVLVHVPGGGRRGVGVGRGPQNGGGGAPQRAGEPMVGEGTPQRGRKAWFGGRKARLDAAISGAKDPPPKMWQRLKAQSSHREWGTQKGGPSGHGRDPQDTTGTPGMRQGPPGHNRDPQDEAGTPGMRQGPPGRSRDPQDAAGTPGMRQGPPRTAAPC